MSVIQAPEAAFERTDQVSRRTSRITQRRGQSVQVHLRLSVDDRELLERIAENRGQTLSGVVRYLLRAVRRNGTH
jgi:hypothetical protein